MRQRAVARPWLAGAVVAMVMLTACDKAAADPTPTPSPSVTVSSPEPTATTDADGRALPGFVTVSADLPAAQSAPAGVLSEAGPGWSLQTYRPQVEPVTTFSGVTPGFPATVQVVYLVSPTGQRYQLLALDPAKPLVINSWTAGESVAYVTQCDPLDCDPTAPTEMLDLTTGELSEVTSLTTTTSLDADMRIGATIVGSHRWWQNDATASALESAGHLTVVQHDWRAVSASPDGAYLAVVRGDEYSPYVTAGVAVVDVATGALTDIAALWPRAAQVHAVQVACRQRARPVVLRPNARNVARLHGGPRRGGVEGEQVGDRHASRLRDRGCSPTSSSAMACGRVRTRPTLTLGSRQTRWPSGSREMQGLRLSPCPTLA